MLRSRNWILLLCLVGSCVGSMGCMPPPYRVKLRMTPQVDPWVSYRKTATICILRHQNTVRMKRSLHYDNDQLVGMTEGNGMYFCYLAKPGRHELTVVGARVQAQPIYVRESKRYYFEMAYKYGSTTISAISEFTARQLLPHLLYAYTIPEDEARNPLHRLPVPARLMSTEWRRGAVRMVPNSP